MADILLQNSLPANALLPGASPVQSADFGGNAQSFYPSSYMSSYPRRSPVGIEGNVFFSPDAQAFDQRIQIMLVDWDWLRQSVSSETVEELEVDYSYMERACAAAQKAPGMRLTAEQEQAYAGLSDFSYTLDLDDDDDY